VHVLAGNVADWTFSRPTTVAGSPANLKVNGNSPATNGTNQSTFVIRNQYGASISNGQPWTLPAAVPQLTPQPAFPESGTTA